MPSPYRESDNTAPAPLAELEWRRRVARSARWAQLLAWAEMALLLADHWLQARFALTVAEGWLVLGIALAVATWMYTAPRSRSAVGWRVWLLRGSVPAYLGVMGLHLLGIHLAIASYTLGAVVAVASVTYVLALGRSQPVPFDARREVISSLISMLALGGALSFGGHLVGELIVEGIWAGLLFVLFAAVAAGATRGAVLPAEHEWWFDNQTGTPGEWVSLFVYRSGHAQVRWIDERPGWFVSKDDATGWLSHQGYVPAERALAERLVDRIPPDNLPRVKPGKTRTRKDKQRVRDDEPRVRVAGEAEAIDGEADALEEPARDDVEPPRAVAVHNPRDPRA